MSKGPTRAALRLQRGPPAILRGTSSWSGANLPHLANVCSGHAAKTITFDWREWTSLTLDTPDPRCSDHRDGAEVGGVPVAVSRHSSWEANDDQDQRTVEGVPRAVDSGSRVGDGDRRRSASRVRHGRHRSLRFHRDTLWHSRWGVSFRADEPRPPERARV